MDETGIMLGHAVSSKVIVPTNKAKSNFVTHNRNRETITVIESITASRELLPPVIIFPGKNFLVGWIRDNGDLLKDWVIALSHNGWIDAEIGYK